MDLGWFRPHEVAEHTRCENQDRLEGRTRQIWVSLGDQRLYDQGERSVNPYHRPTGPERTSPSQINRQVPDAIEGDGIETGCDLGQSLLVGRQFVAVCVYPFQM